MRFLIPFLLLFCVACSQPSANKKHVVARQALKLNDSAISLMAISGDKQKILKMLDEGIAIDSNCFSCYSNKISCLVGLKQYREALETAITADNRKPDNYSFSLVIGMLYDIQDDTVSALKYYNKVLNETNKMLDTMNRSSKLYASMMQQKAIYLIFCGRRQEGDILFKKLYDQEKDPAAKEWIAKMMTASKAEYLDDIFNGQSPNETHVADSSTQFH